MTDLGSTAHVSAHAVCSCWINTQLLQVVAAATVALCLIGAAVLTARSGTISYIHAPVHTADHQSCCHAPVVLADEARSNVLSMLAGDGSDEGLVNWAFNVPPSSAKPMYSDPVALGVTAHIKGTQARTRRSKAHASTPSIKAFMQMYTREGKT